MGIILDLGPSLKSFHPQHLVLGQLPAFVQKTSHLGKGDLLRYGEQIGRQKLFDDGLVRELFPYGHTTYYTTPAAPTPV